MSSTGHSSTASSASRPASKPGATGTKPAPAGPKAAMNMFKQMDAKLPPPKFAPQSAPAAGAVNARNPATIKQMMLKWCQHQVLDYPTVKIENFSSCWADGLAFCALAHHFYSDEFDFAKLDSKNRRHNLTLAFETLKKRADLEPLLEVDDMLAMKDNPDWKCVFTYVQSIYRRFARQSAAPSTGLSDSAANAGAAAAHAGPEPEIANPFRHSVAEDHA